MRHIEELREQAMSTGATYEDFVVGQSFRSRPFRMDRDRIVAFAEEFDPQPQHLSERTAAASQFGELVASGWHTAAVSMRLYVETLPPIAGGGQGAALEELAWPNPVRPGDELRVEADVTWMRESRSRPDKGLVKIRCITLNQRNDIAQTVTHTMMVPRSSATP
jgi:acyl dehydratase